MLLSYVNSLSFVGWWAFAWACSRDERARETTGTHAWEIQRSGVSKPIQKPENSRSILSFASRMNGSKIVRSSVKEILGSEFFKILKIESKVSWDVERKIIYRVWIYSLNWIQHDDLREILEFYFCISSYLKWFSIMENFNKDQWIVSICI